MAQRFGNAVGKSAVFVVNPHQVVGLKIVGTINIQPAVLVEIYHRHAQSPAFGLNTRLLGNINKTPQLLIFSRGGQGAFVSKQFILAFARTVGALAHRKRAIEVFEGIVEQVAVQIAV